MLVTKIRFEITLMLREVQYGNNQLHNNILEVMCFFIIKCAIHLPINIILL